MTRLHRTMVIAGALALALAQVAEAQQQRGRGRGFGTVSQAQLATLDQVQKELELTAEQKAKVNEVNEKLAGQRRELFRDAAGAEGFRERAEQLQKLNTDAESQLSAALEEPQRKRLREIWIQAAGTAALDDEDVAKELSLNEDQQRRLREARRGQGRQGGQNLQDLSPEQRRERFAQARREADERALAVLTAEQKEQFEKMQGKKIELDLAPLRQQQRPQRQRQT